MLTGISWNKISLSGTFQNDHRKKTLKSKKGIAIYKLIITIDSQYICLNVSFCGWQKSDEIGFEMAFSTKNGSKFKIV